MFDELIHGSPYYNGNTEEEVFAKIKYENYQIRDESIRCATVFEAKKFILTLRIQRYLEFAIGLK